MFNSNFADDLIEVEPQKFVTLRGQPVGFTNRWHVNKHFVVEAGPTARHGIILQDARAEPVWFVIVIEDGEGEAVVDECRIVEDEMPTGLSGDVEGREVDPSDLSVEQVDDEK